MSSFLPDDVIITQARNCVYDINVGYQADFSRNGNVDGWDYIDGIYLYTAWVGMLTGYIYQSTSIIGRNTLISQIDAGNFYIFRLGLKYILVERTGARVLPATAKLAWRTVSSPQWDSEKEQTFNLIPDGQWRYYIINLAEAQFWQGSVNDLRIHLPVSNGVDGDQFFIRSMEILSLDTFKCNQLGCSYYENYNHPCGGAGQRGYTQSSIIETGKLFSFARGDKITININGYGDEDIDLSERTNINIYSVADLLSKSISKVNIGGYAEAQVIVTDDNRIRVYSGTYHSTSTAELVDCPMARYLGFFDDQGRDTQQKFIGITPATKYSPISTFNIKTFQLLSLFDDSESTEVKFDLDVYSVEGGRRDWYASGMGEPDPSKEYTVTDTSISLTGYKMIYNKQKTAIDLLHPFNSNGRVNKIFIAGTVDDPLSQGGVEIPLSDFSGEALRQEKELRDAKVFILRPRKGGRLEAVHSISIPNRDRTTNPLFSMTQEIIELDVDFFVNKGDLIGVYNVHMYTGRNFFGAQPDSMYYQIEGPPEGIFDPGQVQGMGGAGLLVYARGNETQRKLLVDVDFRRRYNLEYLEVLGTSEHTFSEVNLAMCVDVNWTLDTFGLSHSTIYNLKPPLEGTVTCIRSNVGYGLNCLSDGITFVRDALAGDAYYIDGTDYYGSGGIKNGAGPGVVAVNPRYFYISGDEEWLGVFLHADPNKHVNPRHGGDFYNDPIAFTLIIPYNKKKEIYKSKIFFKERDNFRTFTLSTFHGGNYRLGNADIPQCILIPRYEKIYLDVKEYINDPSHRLYETIEKYLFVNPSVGHAIEDNGLMINKETYDQAVTVDWQTLTHIWEPIECQGFRIYCERHNSTKICEMGVYSVAEDFGSSFAGSISAKYSHDGEVWWPASLQSKEDGRDHLFIGDTPRYVTLEFAPVQEISYYDVKFNLTLENVHVGEKGCEYVVSLLDSKLGQTNLPQVFNIKNVYDGYYDLYVDISRLTLVERGLALFSTMASSASILNPEFGPSGYYNKASDYPLINYQSNCAINAEVYGLKNLVVGKKSYYSTDNGESWKYFGILGENQDVNFNNQPSIQRSVVNIPATRSGRYFKIGFRSPYFSMRLREILVYKGGVELFPKLYHDKDLPAYAGPLSYEVVHLRNGSYIGSYCDIKKNDRIGLEFSDIEFFDKLVFYHNAVNWYDKAQGYVGIDYGLPVEEQRHCPRDIDFAVWTYLKGDGVINSQVFPDLSYYENNVTVSGSAYVDFSQAIVGYSSIRFPDLNSLLRVDHCFGFDISQNHFSVGTYVRFEEFPANGQRAIIAQKWVNNSTAGSYRFCLRTSGANRILEFEFVMANLSNITLSYTWAAVALNTWYYVSFQRGTRTTDSTANTTGYLSINIGGVVASSVNRTSRENWGKLTQPLEIGVNFKGWISDFILCCDYSPAGTRYLSGGTNLQNVLPTFKLDKRYTIDIYVSSNNQSFGLYKSVDLFKEYSGAEFVAGSSFNTAWYNFFAVDLGKRYALDIVRSYGSPTAMPFDEDSFIAYSNVESNDIADTNFKVEAAEIFDLFTGTDFIKPNSSFWRQDQDGYLFNNVLVMTAGPSNPTRRLDSIYTLMGDFDIMLDYNIINFENKRNWFIGLELFEAGGTKKIRCLRSYRQDIHYHELQDETGAQSASMTTDLIFSGVRLTRTGRRINGYFKEAGQWKMLGYVNVWSAEDVVVSIYVSSTVLYPTLEVHFDNYRVLYGTFSNVVNRSDVRWVRFNLLNGDSTTRKINKIGLYPDIKRKIALNGTGYNCEWEALGSSISNYDEGTNVALGMPLSASSVYPGALSSSLVDGYIATDFSACWLSDASQTQWVIIDLESVKQIYRVKIYHGYNDNDTSVLVRNYTIGVSTDGVSYTTIFNIASNTALLRTHDLAAPVSARYVKMDITSFVNPGDKYVNLGGEVSRFYGVAIREFEVYEYYGYSYISSELYPIVAMNVKKPFAISGHEVVGLYADGSQMWDNTDEAFTFKYDTIKEPWKIKFNEFGTLPNFKDNWIVIKKNTATNYNSGPHYLKHLKVFTSTSLNPTDHPWWWSSSLSEVKSGFGYVENCARPLEINYPASNVADNIFFKGGDVFGVDSLMSWRDGLSFNMSISNLDAVDLNSSYFYLEGLDSNPKTSSIKYIWFMTVLSGSENKVFLKLKEADDVLYDLTVLEHMASPLAVDLMTMTRVGMLLKGKGEPLKILWDGFKIERNHFYEDIRSTKGLYLTKLDHTSFPLAEFGMESGTIEFWIKADYDHLGFDFISRYSEYGLFHIINAANELLGLSLGSYGFGFYYGSITKLNRQNIRYTKFTLDTPTHIAVSFSNTGKYISTDGSTIRLYVNNNLLLKIYDKWDVSDSKMFKLVLGGLGCLEFKEYTNIPTVSSFGGVISNLKVLNYCKTDFSSSLSETSSEEEMLVEKLADASQFIEISPDNLTYYNIESGELPLKFEKVAPNVYTPIYVRSVLPSKMHRRDTRTGKIIVSWELGV